MGFGTAFVPARAVPPRPPNGLQLIPLPDVATLVLAQGRVPEDELWAELEGYEHVVRAGDVLGPRTLEEAVLEGTLAVR